jgi:hypothetical protein
MAGRRDGGPAAEDVVVVPHPGAVVEFDEVERRAVRVLAEAGLVPPLRHQSSARPGPVRHVRADRRAGGQGTRRRTG